MPSCVLGAHKALGAPAHVHIDRLYSSGGNWGRSAQDSPGDQLVARSSHDMSLYSNSASKRMHAMCLCAPSGTCRCGTP